MDLIREHLMYNDVPITICMNKLKPIEQYECIRMILATRTSNVSICTHESVTPQVEKLLQKLDLEFVQCFAETQLAKVFLEEEVR